MKRGNPETEVSLSFPQPQMHPSQTPVSIPPQTNTSRQHESHLRNVAKQLSLQNKLPLLIFLRRLVRLVVLPTDGLLALAARDIADDVAAGGHVSLGGFAGVDVDDGVEEVGLAMLAAEVLYFAPLVVSFP